MFFFSTIPIIDRKEVDEILGKGWLVQAGTVYKYSKVA